MRHVMDVFEEHDAAYLQLILNEISLHEVKIDKVRAAYILEKRMDFKEATFDNWVEFAQRGGAFPPASDYGCEGSMKDREPHDIAAWVSQSSTEQCELRQAVHTALATVAQDAQCGLA